MTKQQRAERTRESIVQAAAEMFERDGIDRVSLAEITRLADVSKGGMYFHFASKGELVDTVYSEGTKRLGRVVRHHCRSGNPPLTILTTLCQVLVRTIDDDVVARAAMRLLRGRATDRCSPRDPYRVWTLVVRRLLARADERGELLPKVDVTAVTNLVVAATAGLEALSQQDRAWWAEHVVADMWRVLEPSLAQPG